MSLICSHGPKLFYKKKNTLSVQCPSELKDAVVLHRATELLFINPTPSYIGVLSDLISHGITIRFLVAYGTKDWPSLDWLHLFTSLNVSASIEEDRRLKPFQFTEVQSCYYKNTARVFVMPYHPLRNLVTVEQCTEDIKSVAASESSSLRYYSNIHSHYKSKRCVVFASDTIDVKSELKKIFSNELFYSVV